MLGSTITEASLFLINTIFTLYLFILMVRFILALSHADYFNPIIQVFIKLTQPLVSPLKRILPNVRGIEFSTLFLIVFLEMIKFFLIGIVQSIMPNLMGLLIIALADTAKLFINTFFYGIFLYVILSWVQPPGYSPVREALVRLTSPVLRPFKRIIPPIAGIDISAIPALIVLQLILILFIEPFISMGARLAYGI